MPRYLKLLVLLALPGTGWAAGLEDPAEWLVKMSQAVHQTSYQGVVVYSSAQRMESLRVLHDYNNGNVRERLTSLSGDTREIFRRDGKVMCVLPEQEVITVDARAHDAASLLPSLRNENLASLRQQYRFEGLGDQRVAERHCLGVRVLPRDDLRYGYEYWLDAKTYLPLRVAVLDTDGQPIEQMMFTEVEFPESFSDEQFQTDADTADYRVVNQPDDVSGARMPVRWSLPESPPGFRKLTHALRRGQGDHALVEHFLYSDGLATISIYGASNPMVDPKTLEAPELSRMGALNVISRVVDGHQVTVVGEVPMGTVQWIADRLRLAPLPVAEHLPGADREVADGSAAPEPAAAAED